MPSGHAYVIGSLRAHTCLMSYMFDVFDLVMCHVLTCLRVCMFDMLMC